MEEKVKQLVEEKDSLTEKIEQLEERKKDLEEQLQDYTQETSQQVCRCVFSWQYKQWQINLLAYSVHSFPDPKG